MRRRKRYLNIFALILLAVWMVACSSLSPPGVDQSAESLTPPAVETASLPPPQLRSEIVFPTARANVEVIPTLVLATETTSPTATAESSPTPDLYAGLSIEELAGRNYGGGQLEIVDTLAVNSYFTRTLITYPSDGLTIYGFMNVPKKGTPPYPVVIALHGYIDPGVYSTLDYTTHYADALAREGFLVLHPNLRGYPPSDEGDNRFRVGMAVDVLNLIALVKALGGQPGPLALADRDAIGLWGHSMGGGIATRVLTVNPDVRAAILYGAMSGDDQKNYERIFSYFSNGQRGQEELNAPPEVFERVSPINYLERVRAAVSIHHGEKDADVPLAWSLDLCRKLSKLELSLECFTYPDQAHTFHGDGDTLFIQRTIDFFNRWLRSR